MFLSIRLIILDTYTWFYKIFACGALFPHDFSKRKSPAARYLLGNLSTPKIRYNTAK